MQMNYNLQAIWIGLSHPFRRDYTATKCGHKTKRVGIVTSLGDSFIIKMPLQDGTLDYCLDCIGKMSIRCAWCANPIHIGDPVTLYTPKESYEIPEHAVRYHKNSQCLVGCLGRDCAENGADRQGFWLPPGEVFRVLSPIEMLIAQGGNAKAVIIGDLSDPKDLGRIVE